MMSNITHIKKFHLSNNMIKYKSNVKTEVCDVKMSLLHTFVLFMISFQQNK